VDTATQLADDSTVIQRVLDHVDNKTTDLATPLGGSRSSTTARQGATTLSSTGYCGGDPSDSVRSAALPDPGSFVAREVAGTPVLAVRGDDGSSALSRTRAVTVGAEVACDATGGAKAFVCPYHGWTYDLDGSLRGLPHKDGSRTSRRQTAACLQCGTLEHGGAVFVSQQTPTRELIAEIEALPELIPQKFRVS